MSDALTAPPAAAAASAPALQVVQDATCTFCGCVCDDIELHANEERIVEAKRDEIRADYLASLEERAQGRARSGTVDALFASLSSISP